MWVCCAGQRLNKLEHPNATGFMALTPQWGLACQNPDMKKSAFAWAASTFCLMALLNVAGSSLAHAQSTVEDPTFKLTLTGHRFSVSGDGADINLRHSSDWGTQWLGYFKSSGLDAHQFRGGWERSFGDMVRVLPSIQVA